MKTQDREIAVPGKALAMIAYIEGMRRVVNHLEPVAVGNALDPVDIAGMAVTMHRHDRRGERRDGGLDPIRI